MKGLGRKFVVSILVAGFLAVGTGAGWTAEDAGTDAVEVGNKSCPVSGEAVGTMGAVVKYEHDGKVYNFCCAMCLKDFKKDPDKFIQQLNAAEEQK